MSALTPRRPSSWKRALLRPLAAPGIPRMIASLTGTQATIFMLHRFAVPELSLPGHPPEIVRAILTELRKQRFEPISLPDLLRKLRDGEPLRRAVAFTIDDGYFDHARAGAPVFAELDFPATIFAVSGFLDGKTWLWWDQIAYAFTRTRRERLKARLADCEIEYELDSIRARQVGATDLSVRCQDVSHAERLACLADLCREADVELPAAPPPEFAPMTWDEARALEKKGISLGPHTVTHPVLSTLTAEDSAAEIGESWARVRAELQNPAPVFCYPHGRKRDFGEREFAEVQRLGLLGGVSGGFDVLTHSRYGRPPGICRVPRCGFREDLIAVLQCVSGVETIKERLRGRL